MELFTAGVAKWLRRRFVVPVFVGSSPIICPIYKNKSQDRPKVVVEAFFVKAMTET